MKYIEIRKQLNRKAGALGLLGAMALTPVLGTTSAAQAAPFNTGERYAQNNRSITVTGTVMRDFSNGREFTIRADNGTTYSVNNARNVGGLSNGDRVRVQGTLRNRVINANSVSILNNVDNNRNNRTNNNRNNNYDNNGRPSFSASVNKYFDDNNGKSVEIRGTVTEMLSNDEVQIMGGNNVPYIVRLRGNRPSGLGVRDDVVIRGVIRNRILEANNLEIRGQGTGQFANNRNNSGNNNGNWNNNNGSNITRQGYVTRISNDRRSFEMRTDDNRVLQVRTRNDRASNVRVGTRVRVYGDLSNNTFQADNVQVVSGNDTWGNNTQGQNVNFTGRITNIDGNNDRLTVVADNGRTYEVRWSRAQGMLTNSRVRVTGTFRNNVVVATNVTRL